MVYLSSLMALDGDTVFSRVLERGGKNCGVEVFSFCYAPEEIEPLKRSIAGYGEHPLSFHGPMRSVEMTAPQNGPEQESLLSHYERAFTLAAWAGAKSMVAHTHERWIPAREKAALQERCRANLREVCGLGRRYGITLRIENVSLPEKGTPLFDEEEYCALIREFEEAQALVDIGHVHVTGWDLERLLTALTGRIGGFHLHNNAGTEDSHGWLSEGTMDMAAVLPLLNRLAPDAERVLEYGTMLGHSEEELLLDIRRVERMV